MVVSVAGQAADRLSASANTHPTPRSLAGVDSPTNPETETCFTSETARDDIAGGF